MSHALVCNYMYHLIVLDFTNLKHSTVLYATFSFFLLYYTSQYTCTSPFFFLLLFSVFFSCLFPVSLSLSLSLQLKYNQVALSPETEFETSVSHKQSYPLREALFVECNDVNKTLKCRISVESDGKELVNMLITPYVPIRRKRRFVHVIMLIFLFLVFPLSLICSLLSSILILFSSLYYLFFIVFIPHFLPSPFSSLYFLPLLSLSLFSLPFLTLSCLSSCLTEAPTLDPFNLRESITSPNELSSSSKLLLCTQSHTSAFICSPSTIHTAYSQLSITSYQYTCLWSLVGMASPV